MSEMMWIRSHVELLLQREWDVCRVLVDPEGDFPFRHGTAACWVSVIGGAMPFVRVYAHAAFGIRSTLKLLRELNEIQARTPTARVTLTGDTVVVAQTVSAYHLTGPVLAQALDEVATVADDIGALLAIMFDGTTPFPQPVADSEEAT